MRRCMIGLTMVMVLLVMPGAAVAQGGVAGSPGAVVAVQRDFQVEGLRLIGTLALTAVAVEFDHADRAEAALPHAPEVVISNGADLRPASVPSLGDEAVAYAGTMPNPDNPDTPFTVAIVAWREDDVVTLLFGAALAGDPLGDLFAVARAIEGREPSNDPVVTPASSLELHRGGLWDQLPGLADVPEGLVVQREDANEAVATPVP